MDRITKVLLTAISSIISSFFIANVVLHKDIKYLVLHPSFKVAVFFLFFVIIFNLIGVIFSKNVKTHEILKFLSVSSLVLIIFFIFQFIDLEFLRLKTIDLRWLLGSWQIQLVLASTFFGGFVGLHLKSGKTDKGNIIIPAIIFAVSSGVYILMALRNHNSFGTPARDLGIFDQAIWNLSIFKAPASTIRGFSNLWGDHWHPALALFAPLYWIKNDVRMILVAQALIVSAGVFGVYSLALRFLKNNLVAIALCLAYAFYGGIQHAINFGFYPENIAPSLMLLSFAALFNKKTYLYFLFFILALLTKENIALYFATFSVILFLTTDKKKTAIITFALSVIYFLVSFKIFLPYFSGTNDYQYANLYANFGSSPLEILKNIILKPNLTITTFFNPVLKLDTLTTTLSSVLFLPFMSVWGLALLPNFMENFLSGRFVQWPFGYHYQAGVTGLLIFASIMSLNNLGNKLPSYKTKVMNAAAVSIFLVIVFLNYVYNLPVYKMFSSPINLKTNQQIISVLSEIPPDASVSAQNTLAPHLSHRAIIYHYPDIKESQYMVLSETLSTFPLDPEQMKAKILEYKASSQWQLVDENADVVLFRKR